MTSAQKDPTRDSVDGAERPSKEDMREFVKRALDRADRLRHRDLHDSVLSREQASKIVFEI